MRLTGAAWKAGAKVGGSMVGGPPRVVWHTTESDPGSIDEVVRWLLSQQTASHLVWDPSTGAIVQLLEANVAARALAHPDGTPETNRQGSVCVQIEVVGRAVDPFTDRPLNGLSVILAWLDELGVPRTGPPDARMSWPAWAAFSGHCGHAHVPGQDHTDPGAIDWQKLIAEDSVQQADFEIIYNPRDRQRYVWSAGGAYWRVPGDAWLGVLKASPRCAGVRDTGQAEHDALRSIALSAQGTPTTTGGDIDIPQLATQLAARLGSGIGQQLVTALGAALTKGEVK